MNTEAVSSGLSAADLAQAFDQSFALAEDLRAEVTESLLAISVSGQAVAVRTADMTGVARLTRIIPVPGSAPGLLGITAVHGALYPVYDLALLVGLPAGNNPSWLILTDRETPVGLVFDAFEGQVEIGRAAICESGDSNSRRHLRAVARLRTGDRPMIDLPGVVEEVRRRAGLREPAKEA